jgi:tetratricopeptide (TPR) repeat protein
MKSYSEYLADSERLSEQDLPAEALRAHLNAVFAYEEENDPERGYEFYLALGDRYTEAGYFEYVDQCFHKALVLAGDDPVSRAKVLVGHAGSSIILERTLDTAEVQLARAVKLLEPIEDEDTEELRVKISALGTICQEVVSRLSLEPHYPYPSTA